MVEEDTRLTQHARSIFADIHINSPISALSEHSTSRQALECETLPMAQAIHDMDELCQESEEEIDNENEDSNDGESAECRIKKAFSESELEIRGNVSVQTKFPRMVVTNMSMTESEGIKLGLTDNATSNFEKSKLQILEAGHRFSSVHSSDQDDKDKESCLAGYLLHDGPCNDLQHSSDSTRVPKLPPEDVHYSETVATILHNNISAFSEGSFISHLSYSGSSSFSKSFCENQVFSKTGASQCMLKYILSILPTIQNKKYVNSIHLRGEEGGEWKGILQDETNGNHVLAERRRREKLNKRFLVLRALVPCVTKMDKASILADTIEYVRQLTQHIHDLESQNKKISYLLGSKVSDAHNQINSWDQRLETNCSTLSASINQSRQERTHLSDTKKLRTLQSTNNFEEATKAVDDSSVRIQVSIIESNAVLELQCPYKDGILLKIMQKLDELNLEITSINSTMANGNFFAELLAKVKEPCGKRASGREIKWAIHILLSN